MIPTFQRNILPPSSGLKLLGYGCGQVMHALTQLMCSLTTVGEEEGTNINDEA
jgi:hypothetical protein